MIDNSTGKVYKYEALARIKKDDGEIILPSKFLDLSRQTKLYSSITKTMIEKTFRDFANNKKSLSINFSYSDINSDEIKEFFYEKLETYPSVAHRLTVEILENEDIQNFNVLKNFYSKIKRYDCKLAIDDFGSGYSNMMFILQLQPDYIKIDGKLIESLYTNNQSLTFVKSIVAFAKKHNITTIAEFVSSEKLAKGVKELGVDISQGYYFSEPVETTEDVYKEIKS